MRGIAERAAAHAGDAGELAPVKAQRIAAGVRHFAADAQPGERRRRIVTAGDNHDPAFRHVRKGDIDDPKQRAVGRHGVQAVEHQRLRSLGAPEQLAKVFARERGELAGVLGLVGGQVLGPCRVELARGSPEVVEEGGDIRVLRVHLVPKRAQAARFGVARREAGLACARRPRDPRHRAPRRAVEPGEQPLARHDRRDHRPRRLGECDA
jgi:hypothetical protein